MNAEIIRQNYNDNQGTVKVYLKDSVLYGMFLNPIIIGNEHLKEVKEYQFIEKTNMLEFDKETDAEKKQNLTLSINIDDIQKIEKPELSDNNQ